MQKRRFHSVVRMFLGAGLALLSVGCASQQPQVNPWEGAAQQANASASRAAVAADRAEAAAQRSENAVTRVENAAQRIEAMSTRMGSRMTERMYK